MDSEGEPRTVRLRVDLSYDGSAFSGWAAQPGRRTVEDVLAAALGRVLRLPSAPKLTVAGRTDAGVHARGQVASLRAARELASFTGFAIDAGGDLFLGGCRVDGAQAGMTAIAEPLSHQRLEVEAQAFLGAIMALRSPSTTRKASPR